MSKQPVQRCFDMSNVAVRHVAVFGNMSNDFFVLSTCRNKLNMFNFFRHVERTSNNLLSKKLVWTTLSTCRTFVSRNRLTVPLCPGTSLTSWQGWGSASCCHCSCGKSSGRLCSHSLGGTSAVPHIHQNEDDCKSTAAPNTTAPGVAFLVSLLS